ncbi:Pentatricopeptide repeat-containing protein At2g33680 [Linum grandiflorum]
MSLLHHHLPSRHCSFFTWLLDCTRQRSLSKGKSVHAQIVKNSNAPYSCVYTANSLVNFYAKCGHLAKAKLVFDHIPHKDVVSWNSLINIYSQMGSSGSFLVMRLFQRMRAENNLPNAHTFAGVFTSASSTCWIFIGKQAQALAIKTADFHDVFAGSSLVNMYCKAGLVQEARKVFDGMPQRNAVSWSTMVSGYASHRLVEDTLEFFKVMRYEEADVNEFVLTSVLSAFVTPEWLDSGGKTVHSLALKNGLVAFVSVSNAIVTMYAKCGDLESSLKMFELSSNKDSITWSAMITGFAQSGDSQKALKLFSTMHVAGVYPSEYTVVGVLNSCSDVAAVEEGKQVHSFLLKLGFETQMFILTALVDMYAKCGHVKDARKGFDALPEPDIVLWTSMIAGYVQNGENEDGLSLYGKMQMQGVLPNQLTMASLLKACSSLAALEQGKQIHGCIVKYGFTLEMPIGSALSTMYAKCGSLDDAGIAFRRMPERDLLSWNAMISGLSHNGQGEEALQLFQEMSLDEGEKLMELGSQESSSYVLLSSIYNALRRPKEVERIRSLMRSRRANKDPGCSWIELKSLFHVFVVGDRRHPQNEEICGEIRRLCKQMKDEGYHPAPDLAA